MRAVVWYGGEDLRTEEVPLQPLQPDEVRIQVAVCGVCGTDVHVVENKFPIFKPPLVLGHEYTGTVVEVGAAVTTVKPGDRVTVDTTASFCDTCYYCRRGEYNFCPQRRVLPGAFAEYTQVPERTVFRIPDEVSFEIGSLTEPLACALHAIDLADIPSGGTVLIIGAGSVGLLLLQLAIHSGAAQVIVSDPIAAKRQLALRLGADAAVDPTQEDLLQRVLDLTGGFGVDRVLEAVGIPPTIEQGARCAQRGGRMVIVGVADPQATITLNPYDIYYRQLSIVGSFIRRYTYPRTINWLTKLDLKPILTNRYPLEQTKDAILAVRGGQGVKNLVVPAGV